MSRITCLLSETLLPDVAPLQKQVEGRTWSGLECAKVDALYIICSRMPTAVSEVDLSPSACVGVVYESVAHVRAIGSVSNCFERFEERSGESGEASV